MNRFDLTVHLSKDPSRTLLLRGGDSIETAALDGCYDGDGFSFQVEAESHLAAAEIAFAVCNSYAAIEPNRFDEMHCPESSRPVVASYREAGNRSLSVGDICIIRNHDRPDSDDGRYGCAALGWVRV